MEKSLQSNCGSSYETPGSVDSILDPKNLIPTTETKGRRCLTREITSATSSANPSRESSPIRPSKLHTRINYSSRSAGVTVGSSRSSKNGTQDLSSPSFTNPPSAATTQRALSTTSIPPLNPLPPDHLLKPAVSQKSLMSPEIKEYPPRWPISPRLRSPPPVNLHSILSPRKIEAELKTIILKKSHLSEEDKTSAADSEAEELSSAPGMRTPARGVSGASSTLETVQEISQPNTPASGLDKDLEKSKDSAVKRAPDQACPNENSSPITLRAKPSLILDESGSESAGKVDIRIRTSSVALPSATRSNGPHTKSYISGGLGRGKPSSEGSARNMTVETETVCSIPQLAVGPGGPGIAGSIRTKPSSETIRPRKEKKKTVRRPPSVTSGTASSKADIFEAKVASAVDEANSSDSEETFVYESNPPDSNDRPRRFHSRTPSATSMASQAEQRNGLRAIMDGHIVVVKKSMKFTNSYNSTAQDPVLGDDAGKGTARSGFGTARGTTQHHHLNIRWGRHAGNSHPSLFDNESPFQNARTSRISGSSSRFSSQPSSPRISNTRTIYSGKKLSSTTSRYELDDSGDNSLTPLLSTVRSGTSARSRRQLGHQATRRSKTSISRYGGYMALCLMILVVIVGAAGFIFATTQPLVDVKVLAIKNVLVSEQDIIFDMEVQARNPNLVAVTIQYTELVVFAHSRYARASSEYNGRPHSLRKLRRAFRILGKDANNLTIEEVSHPNANLEIGHVNTLDNPLTFEGSPFSDVVTTTTSQILIRSPGNKTIPDGSERWGKILRHDFDLILRGILKYTLPLNQNLRSISVESRVTVKPNSADVTLDDTMITGW